MRIPGGSGHIMWGILVLSVLLLPAGGRTDEESGLLDEIEALYSEMGLEGRLEREVFRLAVIGYANLRSRGELSRITFLSIIDYTKPSTEERLFIIDITGRKLTRTSLVAHGKNTGENFAVRFSDEPGSLKSSFGFFTTGETYYGRHGYSLRLHGLEKEFNGNALERYVIIHGAWYVSQKFADRYGRLGRSWGCPALPLESASEIIDMIKGGSCLFVYFNDQVYFETSALLDERWADEWFNGNGGFSNEKKE